MENHIANDAVATQHKVFAAVVEGHGCRSHIAFHLYIGNESIIVEQHIRARDKHHRGRTSLCYKVGCIVRIPYAALPTLPGQVGCLIVSNHDVEFAVLVCQGTLLIGQAFKYHICDITFYLAHLANEIFARGEFGTACSTV